LITLYFAHTSFEAWAELLEALNRAGLKLVFASRFTTESAQRLTARGKMTLDTSLLIACRSRDSLILCFRDPLNNPSFRAIEEEEEIIVRKRALLLRFNVPDS